MNISVLNLTGSVPDERLLQVIRAVNRQLGEDFGPAWHVAARLRLEGTSGRDKPATLALAELRGDAVLVVHDGLDDALLRDFHDRNARGLPCGLADTTLAAALQEAWSVTLSREALRLAADPSGNRLVAGPHPLEDRTVFHWQTPVDAVQAEHYVCDGETVSNFVLPAYFAPVSELGCRCDFLGRPHAGRGLAPFGVSPGGFIGFFDPQHNRSVAYALAGDAQARERLCASRRLGVGDEAVPAPRATTRRAGQRYERIG